MTNLLPPTLRHAQANRRLLVLLGTCGLVCMTAALFVAAALLPAYLAATTEMSNIRARTGSGDSERALAAKKERETVLALRKMVDAFTVEGQHGTGIPFVEQVVTTRPVGTSITALTFTTKGATSTLIIDGTALTRDHVISFVSTIEQLPGVLSAEVPITALAKADDPTFHITVTGTF